PAGGRCVRAAAPARRVGIEGEVCLDALVERHLVAPPVDVDADDPGPPESEQTSLENLSRRLPEAAPRPDARQTTHAALEVRELLEGPLDAGAAHLERVCRVDGVLEDRKSVV